MPTRLGIRRKYQPRTTTAMTANTVNNTSWVLIARVKPELAQRAAATLVRAVQLDQCLAARPGVGLLASGRQYQWRCCWHSCRSIWLSARLCRPAHCWGWRCPDPVPTPARAHATFPRCPFRSAVRCRVQKASLVCKGSGRRRVGGGLGGRGRCGRRAALPETDYPRYTRSDCDGDSTPTISEMDFSSATHCGRVISELVITATR